MTSEEKARKLVRSIRKVCKIPMTDMELLQDRQNSLQLSMLAVTLSASCLFILMTIPLPTRSWLIWLLCGQFAVIICLFLGMRNCVAAKKVLISKRQFNFE